jgi:hypothetical protein
MRIDLNRCAVKICQEWLPKTNKLQKIALIIQYIGNE